MYHGSAHIVLGRWIDVDDHLYVENQAARESSAPLFVPESHACSSSYFVPSICMRIHTYVLDTHLYVRTGWFVREEHAATNNISGVEIRTQDIITTEHHELTTIYRF